MSGRGVAEKVCGVVTGKKNVSKASLRLGWYYKGKPGMYIVTVNDGVVVKGCNFPHYSPSSNP